ncbi:Mu transposase domain-containing protein [Streptomyces sp. NBC_00057]|uniref:Mu transposase domain-containing protein n=1 Tax=Streptomyces sp. NBC_00057 TaxID=2975634 RepID=UPI003246DE15
MQRRVYATPSQEAFLEGHAEAFEVLGGCPAVHIRYDNLKPAVRQVLFGRSRVESARWASFRSWFGLSAFYCGPGVEGAHEKGGVEQEGGRFRRKHLVPSPEVKTLAELNERLAAIDAAEDARHIHGRPTSIGFDFEQERGLLAPLPADGYDTGLDLTPTVHRNSRITVRQCYYSVPARFIGTQVRVKLKANELLVFDGRQVVAHHPRLTRRYTFHVTASAGSCRCRCPPRRDHRPLRPPKIPGSARGPQPFRIHAVLGLSERRARRRRRSPAR